MEFFCELQMVAGSLPASFASSRRCNVSHVVHRNEIEAQSLRFAALETEALRLREKLSSKYSYVSPRVLPPQQQSSSASAKYRTLSPVKKTSPRVPESSAVEKVASEGEGTQLLAIDAPAKPVDTQVGEQLQSDASGINDQAAPMKTAEELEEEAAIAAQLVMPQQQHTGQLLCPGGESRNVDRNQEQTVFSSWDRLSIPRRVLEAHDLFVVTAGRVKPYATTSQSPRRPNVAGGAIPVPHVVTNKEDTNSNGHHSGRGTIRKGLSHLKNSSSVEVCFASISGSGETVASLASKAAPPAVAASRGRESKAPNVVQDDLPELMQACDDALAAGGDHHEDAPN